MIQQALNDFSIDLSKSILIGDSVTDIETAKKMKIKSILIKPNEFLIDVIKKI